MKVHIAPSLHTRLVMLRARVKILDDLYYDYFLSGEYVPGYGRRCLDAKDKCLKEMGIIIGVCI